MRRNPDLETIVVIVLLAGILAVGIYLMWFSGSGENKYPPDPGKPAKPHFETVT